MYCKPRLKLSVPSPLTSSAAYTYTIGCNLTKFSSLSVYTQIKKLLPEKVHTLKRALPGIGDISSVIVAADCENLGKNPHARVVKFDLEVNVESFSSEQIKISTSQHKHISCTCIT